MAHVNYLVNLVRIFYKIDSYPTWKEGAGMAVALKRTKFIIILRDHWVLSQHI